MQGVDGDRWLSQDELLIHAERKRPLTDTAEAVPAATAIRDDNSAIEVSFELSQSNWVVTIRLPGREKMSRHGVKAGEIAAVTNLLSRQRAKAEGVAGNGVRIVTIYEAGLDGFWLHRWLCARGTDSHVVDAASIAAPRRKRRAKSRLDQITRFGRA